MTYAIIETGGKQLRVEPGRFYDIELLTAQPDEKVTINSVLLVQHNGEVSIGQPLVAGATVEGTVLRHLRGRKVLVYKMKPKKKTRKKRGHRQEITRLLIDSITLNGQVFSTSETATTETSVAVVADNSAEETTVDVAAVAVEETPADVADNSAEETTVDVAVEETPADVADNSAEETTVDVAAEETPADVADNSAEETPAE